MCTELGVPIKHAKTEPATTCITFMGLELDSIAMEAHLPHEKLFKLRNLLDSYSRARKITLKNLQCLLGLLNFCLQVVPPGRCFLRRLYDLTKSVTKVSKGAKIRNRYNQVPHLTQDTNGKVTNSQKTPQTRAKRSALSQQVTTKHI